jgi:hypothetical protein
VSTVDPRLKELVLVKAILWARGTDVSVLEREIARLRGLERRPDLAPAA